jgi:carboxylesterase
MPAEHDGGAAPFSASNGPCGVLLLHGYMASPASLRRLAEAFADAGFSVELPLLPGHGAGARELLPLRYRDVASAAEAAYLALAARSDAMVVVGHSMGGTLACGLAERHLDLSGLVLINPLLLAPGRDAVQDLRDALAAGVTVMPARAGARAAPEVDAPVLDQVPIAPLLSLYEEAAGVADALADISCPVLLFSSRTDPVVAPQSSDLVEHHVAGPVERVVLDAGSHLPTLDDDAEEIEHRSVAFALKVAC